MLLMVVVALSCAFMGWAVVYLTAKSNHAGLRLALNPRGQNGQALTCLQNQDEPERRAAANLLTSNEARRIAANIA